MTSLINRASLQKNSSLQMEKSVSEDDSSEESKPAKDEKRYGYALELPYSRQNINFKSRVTRIGRDLMIVGLIFCFLRTGYISQIIGSYMTHPKEVEDGWIKRLFTREIKHAPNTFLSNIKLRMFMLLKRLPVIGYAMESSSWIFGILKRITQNSLGWITILEDHLPDVGIFLLVIGGFLFLMGSTVTLKNNWPSFLGATNCPRCLLEENKLKMAAGEDETLAKRDVELAVPIFKFVKVFPYHKRFSGTTDFSLNSVKMKLIIQFNRATQTS